MIITFSQLRGKMGCKMQFFGYKNLKTNVVNQNKFFKMSVVIVYGIALQGIFVLFFKL